jgi:hypothetical protein
MEFNLHKGIVSYIPPAFFLKGCYAYTHSMYGWANPLFKKTIPQLPAVYDSPASPGTGIFNSLFFWLYLI